MRALIYLLVLSLLEGSSWFLPTARVGPAALSGLDALGAVCLWGLSQFSGTKDRDDGLHSRRTGLLVWVSAGALAVPTVLLLLAQGRVGGSTGAIVLAAVPLVSVWTLNNMAAEPGDLGQRLLPTLAGLAGTLLLLPFHWPLSRSGMIGFALDLAAAIAAGAFGTWARRLARPLRARVRLRQIALGNAAAFLLGALLLAAVGRGSPVGETGSGESLTMLEWGLAGAVVLCTQAIGFWCLGELQPVVFASRFLLVPLVTAVEGWLLWRPSVTTREIVGGVLMVASVALALAEHAPVPTTILPPAAE